MQKHHLPQVVEFSREYDVRVETTSNGGQRVVARIKPPKKSTGYKYFSDLPFTQCQEDVSFFCWRFDASSNRKEAEERADYFWNEFVRYVRGGQRRRRDDAVFWTRMLARELFANRQLQTEADRFVEHLAEALVAHLRFGLDEGEGK